MLQAPFWRKSNRAGELDWGTAMLRGVSPISGGEYLNVTAPSNASVRDHVRAVLEKLKNHQKKRTSTAEGDKKINPDRARE